MYVIQVKIQGNRFFYAGKKGTRAVYTNMPAKAHTFARLSTTERYAHYLRDDEDLKIINVKELVSA